MDGPEDQQELSPPRFDRLMDAVFTLAWVAVVAFIVYAMTSIFT